MLKNRISTSWEKYSTEKNALRCREDIENIIRKLHDKANIEDDPVFFKGMVFDSRTLVRE